MFFNTFFAFFTYLWLFLCINASFGYLHMSKKSSTFAADFKKANS